MGNTLRKGIAAAKASDKEQAFQLLTRATQDPSTAVQAWIWLSGVVQDDSERLFCLDNALRADPNNEIAKRGASMLRQKGIFPAPPSPPASAPSSLEVESPVFHQSESPPPVIPAREVETQQAPRPKISQPEPVQSVPAESNSSPGKPPDRVNSLQGSDARSPELPGKQVPTTSGASPPGAPVSDTEMQAIYQYVAGELSRNTVPQVIERELINRSVPPELAKQIITSTQRALKKGSGEKYRKRMVRGILWTVAGVIVTCGSYMFASDLSGSYLLCWGAIIFGLIDFFVGLFGWLANK